MTHAVEHLYLHIPFCAKICPYCSFYVHGGSRQKQEQFVEALLREVECEARKHSLELTTLYVGGGTPSMLSADLWKRMMEGVRRVVALDRLKEFTVEVNPATVTAAKAQAWRESGVNRVSLGAQSFDQDFLKLLGRQHAPEEVEGTMAQLRDSGFSNINLDLIFALPGQSEMQWEATVKKALALAPEHLSCYGLTVEEDTPFFARLQKGEWEVNEEREVVMFDDTARWLEEGGLKRYEVSNFARPGKESLHNQSYWRGEDYLGCGPSAVSTVEGRRWKSLPDTNAYIEVSLRDGDLKREMEEISRKTRRNERLMLGLRTREGVEVSEFAGLEQRVDLWIGEGLLSVAGGRVRLRGRGWRVADQVMMELMEE